MMTDARYERHPSEKWFFYSQSILQNIYIYYKYYNLIVRAFVEECCVVKQTDSLCDVASCSRKKNHNRWKRSKKTTHKRRYRVTSIEHACMMAYA